MGRDSFGARTWFAVALAGALAALPGCADGGEGGGRDGGGGRLDGSADSGGGRDAFVPPADTGPAPDSGLDGGPVPTLLTCEACTEDWQCVDGFCANLVTGGQACLPGCITDLPECPRNFSCIFDATGTGVDATICAPVGGPCCVDEDGDGYGQGVGCTDTDCNDTDPEVHPDRTEICDGRDTNCNGTIDEPPTDCEAGYCSATGAPAGDYEAHTSATCAAATCTSGTATSCGLYTCSEGGDEGTTCATTCADPTTGADDDTYCIASAHCDAGTCVPDVVDGGTCDEDTDCETSHCDSDICCASGDCCVDATDCPGGGAVTRLCETPADCQGTRGEATCGGDFRCVVTSGIPDDSACDATVTARDCGLLDPIVCTGAATQTPRACPPSCVTDADCVDAAHCTVGVCVPDLPAGAGCGRNPDCQDGLTCVDGVCCTSACSGTCQACNLPGTAGTCLPVPAGGDPSGECPGFSCSGYYTGFAGTDVCYRRSPVSDAEAACDGAGACRGPDLLCPTQAPGALLIDCNDTCQTPRAGTCTGTVAGACDNRDDPTVRTTCGMGDCLREVQSCTGGAPTPCTPGAPVAETCDGRDNDCNGSIDNGTAIGLCGSVAQATAVMCNGSSGCSITMCSAGWDNIDGVYGTGCECNTARGGASCAVAESLGSIAVGGGTSVTGAVPPTGERWFTVSFPQVSGRPVGVGGGTPRIRLTGTSASTHRLQVSRTCSGTDTVVCGTEGGSATATNDWDFTDNQSVPGANQWTSASVAWPTTVYVRVIRLSPATTCTDAQFTLSVTR